MLYQSDLLRLRKTPYRRYQSTQHTFPEITRVYRTWQ